MTPVYRGDLHWVGQIGSLVRFPQGPVDLIGSVTLVGISEVSTPLPPARATQLGQRWLQVQLLGEIDRSTGRFRRGVGVYPGLDDPVHFSTAEELRAIFPAPGERHVRLGRLAASQHVPVCLDVNKLVVRHAAVVGSTGAGKTSAVASLLQRLVRDGWQAAHIIVIDPHGEYAAALGNDASVRSVLATEPSVRLRVPYWALPASDILQVLAGSGASAGLSRFTELVAEERRRFVGRATWLGLTPDSVTADTPVPFDLYEVWYKLDWENNETRANKDDPDTARVQDKGDAKNLRPAVFEPYGPGGKPPHKAPTHGRYGRAPELLRLGLLDPRRRFLLEPTGDADSGEDPLVEVITEWLGGARPISVLDFSGVPNEAADIAIGVVLNLIFEVALRCEAGGPGIGKPSPVLVVLEEAHRYMGEGAQRITRQSVNRIAREGRKYGVGLLLVSQRPDELPSTALAQCGTLIALRLSNATDQGVIRAALPDSVSELAAALPSLRTGEAIVSGEAVVVPARVLIDLPDPQPEAQDPPLEAWREAATVPNLAPALAAWRGTYQS